MNLFPRFSSFSRGKTTIFSSLVWWVFERKQRFGLGESTHSRKCDLEGIVDSGCSVSGHRRRFLFIEVRNLAPEIEGVAPIIAPWKRDLQVRKRVGFDALPQLHSAIPRWYDGFKGLTGSTNDDFNDTVYHFLRNRVLARRLRLFWDRYAFRLGESCIFLADRCRANSKSVLPPR